MRFSNDEQGWKTKLKMPPKDNRKQTTVRAANYDWCVCNL